MHPILFQFHAFGKTVTIASYGLMVVTGIAVAIIISLFISRKYGYDADDVFNYTLLTAVGGIIGAFIAGFFLFLPERISTGFFSFPPALVSWGGIIGGLTVLFMLKRKWSVNLFNYGDIISPGFFTGLGIGRIGCHLGGCCYGKSTACAIGVTFTHPLAPASAAVQPLLPVQLISVAALITIGLAMASISFKRKTPGTLIAATLIIYPLFRFTIEFFRDDPRSFFLGLSDGQIYSITSFIGGLLLMSYLFAHRTQLRKNLYNLHDNPEE